MLELVDMKSQFGSDNISVRILIFNFKQCSKYLNIVLLRTICPIINNNFTQSNYSSTGVPVLGTKSPKVQIPRLPVLILTVSVIIHTSTVAACQESNLIICKVGVG